MKQSDDIPRNSPTGADAAPDRANASQHPVHKRPNKAIVALLAFIAFACMIVAVFFLYVGDYYHDADTQHRNLVSTEQLPVEQGDGFLAFGDPESPIGLVFYPGAKVEYSAYAPLMRELAERGYFAVVVQMPLNFAILDINAADRVIEAYPQVDTWWIGGHSLGGSMAAQYAADHADALAGVVLLGAYTASDLSDTDLGVITIYGSNDQVLNRAKLAESEPLLPPAARTTVIAGGNHAYFGSYGLQSGDGASPITPGGQRARTADAIDAYLSAH